MIQVQSIVDLMTVSGVVVGDYVKVLDNGLTYRWVSGDQANLNNWSSQLAIDGYKYKGGIPIGVGYSMQSNRPIDEREIVETKSDLQVVPNVYAGIVIKVEDEGYSGYIWNGLDQSSLDNWTIVTNANYLSLNITGSDTVVNIKAIQSPANGEVWVAIDSGTDSFGDPVAQYDGMIYDSTKAGWVGIGPLQGPQGIQGEKGDTGDKGDTGEKGDKGDTGPGVASGGTAGQVLAKVNSLDFNTEWVDPATGDGDMEKAVYDTNDNGIVDNSERLGGQLPSHYAPQSQVTTNTSNISTNASNISSNDVDIAQNSSDISDNRTLIDGHTTDIATNASNISSNDTDIASNASNISTNATSISTNASNIATNASNITDVANDLSSHEGDTSNPHQVTLEQARAALNQLNGDIDFNGNSIQNLLEVYFNANNKIDWNDDFKTVNIDTGLGPVLQVGQEIYFLVYNNTGQTVPNGSVIKPTGATMVGGAIVPTFILAQSNRIDTCEGTLFVTTNEILDGELGMGTILGRVSGVDMTAFTPGADVYLSPTVPGGLTPIRPEFPDYVLTVGGTLNNSVNGELVVIFSDKTEDTFNNAWNGCFRETISFLVTSDGTTVTGSLQQRGGGDLTMIFSDGFTMLDCTPAQTITLTPGTATNPQYNFVYIRKDTKTLEVSTTGFPIDGLAGIEHIKIADLYIRDAVSTQSDGALVNRNWNDHVTSTANGHVTHVTERLRQNPAEWYSGIQATCIVDSPTNSNVYISNTAGFVYQLHKQAFPAYDSALGDEIHIVNDSVSPYISVTNLNGQTLDANGVSLGNRSFSFVLWGVQNSGGEKSHLMINLPSGSYAKNSPDDAVNDANNYAIYNIPPAFNGKGFLIARLTFTLSTNGSDWILYSTEDLRGKYANTSAGGSGGGGGGGVTTFSALTDTPSTYLGQASKVVRVGAGESGLEYSDIVASDISDFDTEVSNNADVVANTAKNSYPTADSDKVANISVTQPVDLDTMESDIAVNNAKVGVTNQLDPTDIGVTVQPYDANTVIDSAYVHTDNNFTNVYKAEVDANTLKVGITGQQSSDIIANNAKISYTDAAAVALNTAKVGVTSEPKSDPTGVSGADAIVNIISLTQAEYNAITPVAGTQYIITDANAVGGATQLDELSDVSNVDYTSGHALIATGTDYQSRAIVSADISNFDTSVSSNADVTANTAKISYTDAAAVALNTAKVGYTDALVSANSDVVANTAKVGITAQQATDITTNNAKVGVTDEEANTINSEPIGNESQVLQVVSISQADYDLITPVATTFYIITDA